MTTPTIEQDPRIYFAAERTFLAWISSIDFKGLVSTVFSMI
jgi:uncharacterized membrane protein YidH (DUF202 family)